MMMNDSTNSSTVTTIEQYHHHHHSDHTVETDSSVEYSSSSPPFPFWCGNFILYGLNGISGTNNGCCGRRRRRRNPMRMDGIQNLSSNNNNTTNTTTTTTTTNSNSNNNDTTNQSNNETNHNINSNNHHDRTDTDGDSSHKSKHGIIHGLAIDVYARATIGMSSIFLGPALLQLANIAAGCSTSSSDSSSSTSSNTDDTDTSSDICWNTIYGFRPSSLLTNIAAISGIVGCIALPFIGSMIDHTPYRKYIGYTSGMLLCSIKLIEFLCLSSIIRYYIPNVWFYVAWLQIVSSVTFYTHLTAAYAYISELSSVPQQQSYYNTALFVVMYTSTLFFMMEVLSISSIVSYWSSSSSSSSSNTDEDTSSTSANNDDDDDGDVATAQISLFIAIVTCTSCFYYSWTYCFPFTAAKKQIPPHQTVYSAGFYTIYHTLQQLLFVTTPSAVAAVTSMEVTSSSLPGATNATASKVPTTRFNTNNGNNHHHLHHILETRDLDDDDDDVTDDTTTASRRTNNNTTITTENDNSVTINGNSTITLQKNNNYDSSSNRNGDTNTMAVMLPSSQQQEHLIKQRRRNSVMLSLLCSIALSEAASNAVIVISTTYMKEVLHFNGQNIGIVFLIVLLSGIPGSQLGKFVTITVCSNNPVHSVLCCNAIFGISTILAATVLRGPNDVGICYIFGVCWGICLGWLHPQNLSSYVPIIPRNQEAEMMGLFLLASQILAWLPPTVFTVMNELRMDMSYGLGSLSIYFICSILCLLMVGDYHSVLNVESDEYHGVNGHDTDHHSSSTGNRPIGTPDMEMTTRQQQRHAYADDYTTTTVESNGEYYPSSPPGILPPGHHTNDVATSSHQLT